ncbi:MAG: hypothetical protein ABWY36_00805 [Leifsonia sp.]
MTDRERRRLAARVYSREGAAEPLQTFRDPQTGREIEMTASAWELRLYDDAHPDGMTPEAARTEPDDPAEAEPVVASAPRARRRSFAGGAAVGAGIVAIAAIVLITTRPAGLLPGSEPVATTPPAPSAMLEAVFESEGGYDAVDPGPIATAGYDAASFRRLATGYVQDDGIEIFAAKRDDGQFCLVTISDGRRVVSQCATAEEIGAHGLHVSKDAKRAGNPGLFTLTVTWQTDGLITWAVVPVVTP